MRHRVAPRRGLEEIGIEHANHVYWTLSTADLYDHIIRRNEGRIAHLGPMVVRTGHHTGRSPRDKFIVREPGSESLIWWGKVNRPLEMEQFERLYARMLAYLHGRDLYVQDCFAGAELEHRIGLRVITEFAWHSLFARNLFIQATEEELVDPKPDFTIICAPGFHAVPETDGTRSEVFIIINFAAKLVLIGGTEYAGEIKKAVFTILNYLLPRVQVLSMHCSANMGDAGDVAIFFGLSGTGKTTLSAASDRTLIGDDEHGWSDRGIFNFEGGCYAKVINLSEVHEPEIFATTRRFGTLLENVTMNRRTGRLNLDDASLTENTRAAYPLAHIPNAAKDGLGGHPNNIVMLTADAFGVLPPVSKLTAAQAVYHFLSGYTSKVAGTEKGITEPEATFSTCFGSPFMALEPSVYANLLGDRIAHHDVDVWLVNTGWSGGPYGIGKRIEINYTRAMIRAILDGSLASIETRMDPVFGLALPVRCPGVPDSVLDPRSTWADGEAYDVQARDLATMFIDNFAAFAERAPTEVRAAGPLPPG
jgi:phosphoenolpyruvate carboxykinase (ATP)